jgi:hypothetical protein
MGDRRPKDSGGANHHYKNVQGNHKQRNQQANHPLFNDNYSNDLQRFEKG